MTSRFTSLDYVKQLLSDGFVEGIVDGLMAILTLTMMFIFSPKLAFITLAAVSIYTIVRCVLYQPIKQRTNESIQFRAVGTGLFYESVRSAQPIKLFNGEPNRQAKLDNANADWMNADVKVGRLEIYQNTTKEFSYGIDYILIIWVGAVTVIAGDLTVGALMAFLAYRQQFALSSQILLDKIFEWKMLQLHLTRLADIALEPEEEKPRQQFPRTRHNSRQNRTAERLLSIQHQ